MASHSLEKSAGPTWILNGASVHVEEARTHIARISGEFDLRPRVFVTQKGDELRPLFEQVVTECLVSR